MNSAKFLLIASTAAACVFPAFASEADAWQNVPQMRSTLNPDPAFAERTRSDVRNEFLNTRREAAAMRGEDSGSVYLGQAAARARREVIAVQPYGAR
jgi:hypothetical protein